MRPNTLNTKDAASYLGLASSTLEKGRVSGRGPRFIKLGRAVRYLTLDLDAYLQARVKNSTSETISL